MPAFGPPGALLSRWSGDAEPIRVRVCQTRAHRNVGFEQSVAISIGLCCNMATVSKCEFAASVPRSTVLSAAVLAQPAVALPPQASGFGRVGWCCGRATLSFGVVGGVMMAIRAAVGSALGGSGLQAGCCAAGAPKSDRRILCEPAAANHTELVVSFGAFLGVSRLSRARVLTFAELRAAS